MAYRNQYNTRNSGRYNTPGQFVPAGEMNSSQNQQYIPQNITPIQQQQQPMQTQQSMQVSNLHNIQLEDTKMEGDTNEGLDTKAPIPYWMKSKLAGGVVKKLSMKERRRRQNENLRRLLTPKNALMVLNEMMPNKEVNNQFTVEPAPPSSFYGSKVNNFCADLIVEGTVYKGFGDNKLSARNSAAEQAIRDLIIRRIERVCPGNEHNNESETGEEDSATLPMIQLASFALHKLFSEWECDGHKVPTLRPQPSVSEGDMSTSPTNTATTKKPAKVKKPKEVPTNASSMHPCMLLTYLRPALSYRELPSPPPVDNKQHNQIYIMAVDVDGNTYTGKAGNKKEARRLAAAAACAALFNVQFHALPSDARPLPAAH